MLGKKPPTQDHLLALACHASLCQCQLHRTLVAHRCHLPSFCSLFVCLDCVCPIWKEFTFPNWKSIYCVPDVVSTTHTTHTLTQTHRHTTGTHTQHKQAHTHTQHTHTTPHIQHQWNKKERIKMMAERQWSNTWNGTIMKRSKQPR